MMNIYIDYRGVYMPSIIYGYYQVHSNSYIIIRKLHKQLMSVLHPLLSLLEKHLFYHVASHQVNGASLNSKLPVQCPVSGDIFSVS